MCSVVVRHHCPGRLYQWLVNLLKQGCLWFTCSFPHLAAVECDLVDAGPGDDRSLCRGDAPYRLAQAPEVGRYRVRLPAPPSDVFVELEPVIYPVSQRFVLLAR